MTYHPSSFQVSGGSIASQFPLTIQFMIPALIDKDTHVFISFGNAVLDTMSVVYHSCVLLWVPLFLPRKEEETAEKKKQEQAAAEQKQAPSCTLLQRTCHHQ